MGIGDDLRKNFQLDQTEFQNAVSGNGVSCAQKFKAATVENPWVTPMIWSGNEVGPLLLLFFLLIFLSITNFFFLFNKVPGFHDNSGSYGRRIVAFLFEHVIHQQDSSLFQRMMDELPRFICKCNRVYRNMIRSPPPFFLLSPFYFH